MNKVLSEALSQERPYAGRRDTDTSEDDSTGGGDMPVPVMQHADSGERTRLMMNQGIKPKIHRRRSSILSSHHVPPPQSHSVDMDDDASSSSEENLEPMPSPAAQEIIREVAKSRGPFRGAQYPPPNTLSSNRLLMQKETSTDTMTSLESKGRFPQKGPPPNQGNVDIIRLSSDTVPSDEDPDGGDNQGKGRGHLAVHSSHTSGQSFGSMASDEATPMPSDPNELAMQSAATKNRDGNASSSSSNASSSTSQESEFGQKKKSGHAYRKSFEMANQMTLVVAQEVDQMINSTPVNANETGNDLDVHVDDNNGEDNGAVFDKHTVHVVDKRTLKSVIRRRSQEKLRDSLLFQNIKRYTPHIEW